MSNEGRTIIATADADTDAEAIEFGRWLFAQACDFVAGATNAQAIPPARLPEIAFAGRSNVGKSSLINALTGRRTLARVSHTPGRTRQVNFFDLGGRLMLVDLPGYGYARAPKHTVRDWTRLIEDYLRGRQALRRVCLLIDARRGVGAADRSVMELLDGVAVSYQVVLTKLDQVPDAERQELHRRVADELAARGAAHPTIVATSARDGEGIPPLRAMLAALAHR